MVPLPQVVVQVFARRLAGRESDPQAPAVLSPRGGMLRANNWRRDTKWNTAIKQAGVAPLTIHDLRHTYASVVAAGQARERVRGGGLLR
jgi:integrase